MSSSWHSYPSIFNLGHAAIKGLFGRKVNVEEKIDGSQFSFGLIEGEVRVRSKGKEMHINSEGRVDEKMFNRAIATALELKDSLHPEWTYRAEYLEKPKHNVLAYSRVPKRHLIIFDINDDEESYLSYEDKLAESIRLDLECVDLLASGLISSEHELKQFLETESALGGQKIEGMVIKPTKYDFFGPDKKVLMGKHVSEAFKESHRTEWKQANPAKGDLILFLSQQFKTVPRWQKAVQHLRDAGRLLDAPQDIGNLIKEVHVDIEKEEAEYIKEKLFKWAMPQIIRNSTIGLPEWYKDQLMKKQFEDAGSIPSVEWVE